MQVSVNTNDNINGTLVLPIWQDSNSMASGSESGVHRSLKNQIETILSEGDFKAKAGSAMTLAGTDGGKAMLIGLGKAEDANLQSMRESGAKVTASLSKIHGKTITVKFSGMESADMGAFVEGMILRDYSYDKYKSKDEDDDSDDGEVHAHVTCEAEKIEDLQKSETAVKNCDLLIAIGTSLAVGPINQVVPLAYQIGVPVVIINGEKTEYDHLSTFVINADIRTTLSFVCG